MEEAQVWIFTSQNEIDSENAIGVDGTVQPVEVAAFTATKEEMLEEIYKRRDLYLQVHHIPASEFPSFGFDCRTKDNRWYRYFIHDKSKRKSKRD